MILILFIICLNFFCLLFLILFKFPSGMKRDIFSQSIFMLIFGLHDLNIHLQMVVLFNLKSCSFNMLFVC